jgi:hypothetical protein
MPVPTQAGQGSLLIPLPSPEFCHLPPQTDTEDLSITKTLLYKLTPTTLCPSLSLLPPIIRVTGVWAPPTPPELKPTFEVGTAQGEQRKVQLLLPFISTLSGLWKHTLTRGSGQQRKARVQARGREGKSLSATEPGCFLPGVFTSLPNPCPKLHRRELRTSLRWYSPAGAENSARALASHHHRPSWCPTQRQPR